MLNKRTFAVDLDLKDIDKPAQIVGKVKQLDGTRIVATLTNFGEPMDLSDCLVRMFIIRPDKTELYQKEYIEISEGNVVIIDCVDEIFEFEGDVQLEIEIIDLDGYIETMPTIKVAVLDKINDDTQREIIRIEEISMMEELKDYIINSSAYIDSFKQALDEFADPDYNTLLEGLISTKEAIAGMAPQIQEQEQRLMDALAEVNQKEIDFADSETLRQEAESTRDGNEIDRQAREEARRASETFRESNESIRVSNEEERMANENLRINYEETRNSNEATRESNENQRIQSENTRVLSEEQRTRQEEQRQYEMETMRNEIQEVTTTVENIPNNGNFNVDLVVKGNVYPTLDGVKPVHQGPPTKNAGNVLMPYARAIGGFTKDGSGVRTIGFVAKPKDANPSLDITEDQNSDAIFLGTNVSQLFLYSKERYPTIVAQETVSPIATQDWVMRLLDGLGILNKGEDPAETITTKDPTYLFDEYTSDSFSNIMGEWSLDPTNSRVVFTQGEEGKYKALIGFQEYNEVTFSYTEETCERLFIGLWRTESYLYGARIRGNTLSVSYFDRNGIRGGAYTLTIREGLMPGEKITVHYNYVNEIWEFYKYDENFQPILIYQLSKFMMSGFPEFNNGKNVSMNFSVLMNGFGSIEFYDSIAPLEIKNYSNVIGYSF